MDLALADGEIGKVLVTPATSLGPPAMLPLNGVLGSVRGGGFIHQNSQP